MTALLFIGMCTSFQLRVRPTRVSSFPSHDIRISSSRHIIALLRANTHSRRISLSIFHLRAFSTGLISSSYFSVAKVPERGEYRAIKTKSN